MTGQIAITGLAAGTVKSTDVYPAVDTTDTSQSPQGTTKKYTIAQLKTSVASSILSWATVSSTSQTIAANMGYYANNAGLVTFTTPATPTDGQIFLIVGVGAGGWGVVLGDSGQTIRIGGVACTTGSGSIASTNRYDTVHFLYRAADSTWYHVGAPQGNIDFDVL